MDKINTDNPNLEIPPHPPEVQISALDNGLTIIVGEDHSSPVVSVQAWCKTGSIDEDKWMGAGLSHVLEHMLFKGTTSRPASRIDQEVQEAGGYMNAYTSFDRTVYWINAPSTGTEVAIDILGDIMQNATLPEDELAKELDVIRREMDMGHDDPARRSSQRLFEVAYTQSPYRYPIIGQPKIFDQLSASDIKEYYRARYSPNNLFFVVVGDVNPKDVIDQIQAAFTNTLVRPIPPCTLPEEPKQTATREIIEEADIELGHPHFSWHVPDIRHPDIPLLDILATLLGSGHSSRLFQKIREELGLAHSIDAWTYTPGNAGLFGISAIVDGEKFSKTRQAILQELSRLQEQAISSDELLKVVKQFTSATLATRKTMQGQAQNLGANWMAANDLNFSERYLAAVKRATPDDLQRTAQKYLTLENRSLYALLPTGSIAKPTDSTTKSVDHPIRKFDLSNGLRLLVKEEHRLPFVQFRTAWQGGVLAETRSDNGLSNLMSKLLLKGTPTRSAEKIALEIESIGGSIESYGGNNSFGLSVEVLKDDFQTGLEILADTIQNPTFPKSALERERQIQLASIKAQKDHVLQRGFKLFKKTLFGNTGYGLDGLGNETSVQGLQTDDLLSFHKRYTIPNNCVLAIYGDVKTDELVSAVEKEFKDWCPSNPVEVKQSLDTSRGSKRAIEAHNKKQAVLIVGCLGVTIYDEDRYALDLIQEACSDLGSRLFLRIREELGLAYYVGAQNFVGLIPGCFAFYGGTSPEKVDLVEQEILAETALLREQGLSAEELKRSKAKIIGQRKIARQELGGYALNTALDELYGLGYSRNDTEDEHYEAVNLERVVSVANKYLASDNLFTAIVKP